MLIGMDFGTTNSGMSVFDGDRPRLIPLDPANANPQVARTALYISKDRGVYIGREAIDRYYGENLNRPFRLERVRVGEVAMTFAELPTFIRDVYIERDVYAPGRLFLSFKMGLSSPELVGTIVGSEYYYLEDIIAMYLYVTKKRAEAHLGTELKTIVLGRPVRYSDDLVQNDVARERMLQAAFRAGYEQVYLEYEPIAAAYHYETTISKEENVLIFDFGGGTLDISIMRLGNPKTRRVIANGGIPIAGDVFDRKIVRAKFPPHFGEGGTYRHGRQELPIPSSYYEAFANWQELLMLQLPDRLETIRTIARTSAQRRKLEAFINLITSSYGLKLYDYAEAAKRELSAKHLTFLQVDGSGFAVRDTLSRQDFEKLIRADVRAIGGRLDAVMREAGLSPGQIDTVIRTGGSSQIPAFIDLLNKRFGAEKVRDIDVFSSVTSGLGIIGHRIETGELDLPAHTRQKHAGGDYLNRDKQGGIPVVNLDMMKKFVDLKETKASGEPGGLVLVGLSPTCKLQAVEISRAIPESGVQHDAMTGPVDVLPADERILLMTTEFRFFVKPVRQLADLKALGLTFETAEDFHSDPFGDESVCALARWSDLQDAERTALLTTRGFGRVFVGESFVGKLDGPIGYKINGVSGYPAALLKVTPDGELVVISDDGRAVRIAVRQLSTREQRLIKIPAAGKIIGAFNLTRRQEMIITTASGYAKRVQPAAIPLTEEWNSNGVKLINGMRPAAAALHIPGRALYAVTSQRVVAVDAGAIPALDSDSKLLQLKKNETLIRLVYGAEGMAKALPT